MKKTTLALSLLLSSAIYAHDRNTDNNEGDHDEENGEHHHHDDENSNFDVESYLLTLQGTQAFGEACYIGVKEEGLAEDGLYFADVETSFAHEGVGAGVLHVTQDKENPRLLTATKEDGSRISIELSEEGTKVSDSLRYAVRWKHEDHVDSGLCSDLKVIHDAAAEKEENDSPVQGDSPVQAEAPAL